jgi:mannose/fructose/N-acetylgalactosamine-specific phosphotransferase system component IID
MQNVGFLFLLAPFLDKFYPEVEKRKEAYLRHLEFFNTHPYMAVLIIVLTEKMEREAARGNSNVIPMISKLKQSMASPLAAMGDSFFWGTLENVAALGAVFFIVFFYSGFDNVDPRLYLLIPLGFFLIYNFFHLFIRYFFASSIFIEGRDVLGFISKPRIKQYMSTTKAIAVAILAIVIGAYFYFYGWRNDRVLFFEMSMIDILVFVLGFVLSLSLNKFTSAAKVYLVILLCVIWAYLGN